MYLPDFFGYKFEFKEKINNPIKEKDGEIFLKILTMCNLSIESRFNSINERLLSIYEDDLDDNVFVAGISKELKDTLLYVEYQMTKQKRFIYYLRRMLTRKNIRIFLMNKTFILMK